MLHWLVLWYHSHVLAHIPAFPYSLRGEGTHVLQGSLCSDSGLELLHLNTGPRVQLVPNNYTSVLGNLTWLSLVQGARLQGEDSSSSHRCWKVVLLSPFTDTRAETQELGVSCLWGPQEIRDQASGLTCYCVTTCSQRLPLCAAMKGTVFASFTPFRVRSCNVSLWLLQMISTHVHSKLGSINQCPVTSHREAINRQQEKKVLHPFQGKGSWL